MAKMYTLDKKLLTGTPEIRIGDKVYPVDDRQKTVRKIIKLCDEAQDGHDFEKIDEVLKLALSPKDFKEIDGMELSWAAYQELFELVISAVMGQDHEKAGERFQGESE